MDGEFNVSLQNFRERIDPYLKKLTSEIKVDEGKYNKMIVLKGEQYIDIFQTHEGIMIQADFCSKEVISKLEELSR